MACESCLHNLCWLRGEKYNREIFFSKMSLEKNHVRHANNLLNWLETKEVLKTKVEKLSKHQIRKLRGLFVKESVCILGRVTVLSVKSRSIFGLASITEIDCPSPVALGQCFFFCFNPRSPFSPTFPFFSLIWFSFNFHFREKTSSCWQETKKKMPLIPLKIHIFIKKALHSYSLSIRMFDEHKTLRRLLSWGERLEKRAALRESGESECETQCDAGRCGSGTCCSIRERLRDHGAFYLGTCFLEISLPFPQHKQIQLDVSNCWFKHRKWWVLFFFLLLTHV